jgi:cytochrome c2
VAGVSLFFIEITQAGEPTAAARGREIIFKHSLNPPLWSDKAYDNAWKRWGLEKKPPDYESAFQERYGLHANPFDKQGLPLGLMPSKGLLGKGIVNNCLMCHAGSIAGQTYIGLGNASLDLQGLFDELSAADGLRLNLGFQFSHVRGTIDPVSPVAFLMGLRDAALNLQKPVQLDYFANLCSDPPAWWLLKKKKTRDWTGGIDARSTRVDMANLLSPFNSGDYIKKQEPAFANILAFLLSVESPKYPFPVQTELAARGRELFSQTCAKCHGTYGPGGTYPNKIVPLHKIGTDQTLANAISFKNLEHYNKSWFAREKGPDGQFYQVVLTKGYQAPPLDGVWATAPYFHNASVPTIYHVLNSRVRPKIYTRSFRTGKEDYDQAKLGWKITVLDNSPDLKLPGRERRKIYDTTLPGQSNNGHTFGDEFTEEERMAVIEYLKTL